MIYSMTGYASATREVASDGAGANGSGVGVSVELRTVNSRFLDMNFRMPEDVRVCEPQLREMLMNKLSRGKVDIRINLNRAEQTTIAQSRCAVATRGARALGAGYLPRRRTHAYR
jgi:uncharacterized protein (TIGR00255 family)